MCQCTSKCITTANRVAIIKNAWVTFTADNRNWFYLSGGDIHFNCSPTTLSTLITKYVNLDHSLTRLLETAIHPRFYISATHTETCNYSSARLCTLSSSNEQNANFIRHKLPIPVSVQLRSSCQAKLTNSRSAREQHLVIECSIAILEW